MIIAKDLFVVKAQFIERICLWQGKQIAGEGFHSQWGEGQNAREGLYLQQEEGKLAREGIHSPKGELDL